MQIGSIKLQNLVISAPMAGVTDKAYRLLAKKFGCGLVYSEMLSSAALAYGNRQTLEMLDFEGEDPIAVQIFGSDPRFLAEAARMVEQAGASIIDINMGCPTPKIVNNGDGAALMRDPVKACEIIRAVVRAVSCPVTVKMRKGWNRETVNAIELALAVTEAGAAAITVHGRTRDQFYRGEADWRLIARIVEAVNVPVIGNGDIWQAEDARKMLNQTSCDGVMLARGALGNPWLFLQTKHYLETEELLPGPDPADKVRVTLQHFALMVKYKGETRAIKEMRKHFSWYLKGLKGAAKVRQQVMQTTSLKEIELLFEQYKTELVQ